MAEQFITPEVLPSLKEWFDYNASAGCTMEQMKETLLESGFVEPEVDRFLAAQSACWSKGGSGEMFDAEPIGSAGEAVDRFWRRSDILNAFNRVALGERVVRVLAKSPPHGVYFIPDFLSEEECDALILGAGDRMSPSMVLDETEGADVRTHSRSSRGTVISRGSTELASRIESRISRLTALPASHGEGFQILQYGVGGEYRPHVDYFDPNTIGGARALTHNSQRLVSVIIYLSEVEAGGCTAFPELGLAFSPMKGAALLFPSIGRDGSLLESSLHAGLPVTSGEKWIATKWIRLTPQSMRR